MWEFERPLCINSNVHLLWHLYVHQHLRPYSLLAQAPSRQRLAKRARAASLSFNPPQLYMADSAAGSSYDGSSEPKAPSTRKRILMKGTADRSMDMITKKIKQDQHAESIMKVVAALEKDPELTNYVVYILETGKLKEDNDPRLLPAASNKFNLVSMRVKEQILMKLWPQQLQSSEDFKKLRAKDKQFVHKALQFALAIDLRCAVFSKNIGVLMDKCMERYDTLGKRLARMGIQNNELQWSTCGIYKFLPEGATIFTKVVSVHGEEADLDLVGHDIDNTWAISKNFDVEKAMLQKGRITLNIWTLYNKEQHEKMKLLNLSRVPESSGSQAASVITRGYPDASVLSSPLIATPPRLPVAPPGEGSALAESD
jgi:hypothetical protein